MKQLSKRIAISIGICLGVGLLASVFTAKGVKTWYPYLDKPSFNPPNWLFAPVWTVLYILMGISVGLVWAKITEKKSAVGFALFVFLLQLVANALWSFLFFAFRSPFWALVDIAVLLVLIASCILLFHRIHRTAAYLLVPYLLWVAFAMALNYSIYLLN